MYNVRESWTDERLDDFRGEVNRRFDEARDEVNRRFDAVDRRFDEANLELRTQRAEMKDGFAEINRTMLRLGGGAIVTFVVGFAGMIATQL